VGLPGSRIVLLAAANSIHTVRWANGLAGYGMDVHVVTMHAPLESMSSAVTVHQLPCPAPLGYYANACLLRRLLQRLRPAIVNAHYASGYGTLARLAQASPLLLSAWGSDIYEFPHRSRWHYRALWRNFAHATALGSTGHAMARRMQAIYPGKRPFITPFGVDVTQFAPRARPDGAQDGEIVIGTVKGLAPVYGIDRLLRAFVLLADRLRSEGSSMADRLALRIYGSGTAAASLGRLATSLGLDAGRVFCGAVPHQTVPQVLNGLDVFVALSRRESFGVAILEASACGRPVVVSDADGLAELTRDGETGFVVESGDPEQASQRLYRLVTDTALRQTMGAAGRAHVQAHYTWQRSLDAMMQAYEQTIRAHRRAAGP